MPGSVVVKETAGFVGPEQTAKSFVGQIATSTTVPVTQTLETVTARTTQALTFEGVLTSGSPVITEVSAYPEGLLLPGSVLSGTGVPAGATVVRPSGEEEAKKELRMSANAESTQVKKALTYTRTLSAGKTFYITDIYLATDAKESAQVLDVRLQAAGTDIFRAGIHSLSPVMMPGIETQIFATEGQVVTILLPVTAAIQKLWFGIQGFEQ